MSKYYAVKNGRQTGIYNSWSECEAQVKGFKGALYKSFSSLEDAHTYLENKKVMVSSQNGLIAYVDGSYNVKTSEYGYGCVLIEGANVIKKFYGKGDNPEYASMRNVAGEIIASMVSTKYAIEHGYDFICIYYDYEGIEKWATHTWKANKEKTKMYVQFMDESRKSIDISFMKVLAHSGDQFNDMADSLAKKAVGIK